MISAAVAQASRPAVRCSVVQAFGPYAVVRQTLRSALLQDRMAFSTRLISSLRIPASARCSLRGGSLRLALHAAGDGLACSLVFSFSPDFCVRTRAICAMVIPHGCESGRSTASPRRVRGPAPPGRDGGARLRAASRPPERRPGRSSRRRLAVDRRHRPRRRGGGRRAGLPLQPRRRAAPEERRRPARERRPARRAAARPGRRSSLRRHPAAAVDGDHQRGDRRRSGLGRRRRHCPA